MLEQPFLAPESSGIAYQLSVRSDDAVTGYNNGDGIFTISVPDGPVVVPVAEFNSEIEIGTGLSIRNQQQLFPGLLLELAAFGLKRKIEYLPCTREIFFQLL